MPARSGLVATIGEPIFLRIVVTATAFLCAVAPASALDANRWQPRDVVTVNVSTDDVAARVRTALAPHDTVRSIRATLRAGSIALPVKIIARGQDVRFEVAIGASLYAMGRVDGVRWRTTPNGITRVVRSDVQGDDLDRWPIAPFAPLGGRCHAIGTSGGDDVVACRDDSGEARFLYVAPSGRIDRETMRDGSRVSTFRFRYGEVKNTLPVGWSVDGAGGVADLTIESDDVAGESDAAKLDPPFRQTPIFNNRSARPAVVGHIDRGGAIFADVRVNGRMGHFEIDDGTSQILLDSGFARRVRIPTTFGHGLAGTMDVGSIHADDLAIQTADMPNLDGILGFEFFLGCVVHVDYDASVVEMIPHSSFSPPPDARQFVLDVGEGLPLVPGKIGNVAVTRIVPDLGSTVVVIPRYFSDTRSGEAHLNDTGPRTTQAYLEGSISASVAQLDSLQIGTFEWRSFPVSVEIASAKNIEIPLDAIVGSRLLRSLEWWFDYDDASLYMRSRGR